MDPVDVKYLRALIKRATPTTDTAMWVRQEDWAKYLTWALDELEKCQKGRRRKG